MLQAETANSGTEAPLSDYEGSIESSSASCRPTPRSQRSGGVTTETLGGIDTPRREARRLRHGCASAGPLAPEPIQTPGNINDDIEEQGPSPAGARPRLFATRPKMRDPTSTGTPCPPPCPRSPTSGTGRQLLSYGPDKRYGPTEYQVVKLHVNSRRRLVQVDAPTARLYVLVSVSLYSTTTV